MNVRKHKCNHPTCTTSPVFGVAGTRKAEFCAPHAKEGMVPVSGKKCSGADCTKQLVYGLMGTTKAIVCVQHREGGLVNVVSKRCGSLDCTKMASFGRVGDAIEYRQRHTETGDGHGKLARKTCSHTQTTCTRRRSGFPVPRRQSTALNARNKEW